MVKIYVASFHRASDGAVSKLLDKMEENDMLCYCVEDSDYVLAVGDRQETFDFVLEQYRKNKKIIHLWAGEISQGTHDEVYRHSMSLMSCMQLCTNDKAKERVMHLGVATSMAMNPFVVGNVYLDNLEVNENFVLLDADGVVYNYDVVLYNPPTLLSDEDIDREVGLIESMVRDRKYVWIEPNRDRVNSKLDSLVNSKTLPRPDFLKLVKECDRFITNSSCQYYEGLFLKKPQDIISIGVRNENRESRFTDLGIKDASDNIITLFKGLK